MHTPLLLPGAGTPVRAAGAAGTGQTRGGFGFTRSGRTQSAAVEAKNAGVRPVYFT